MRGVAIRPGAAVTLAYLLVTLPLYSRGVWTTQHTGFFVAHVAAAAGVWWAIRQGAERNRLADWLPLLLVPFLYAELPYLMGDAVYRDALVQAWERSLFGSQPARTLAAAAPNVALSELLHLGYFLYYPVVYVPPLVMYLRRDADAYTRALLALMLTYATCFLVFAVFPVEGPRYAWGPAVSAPGGPMRSLVTAILERGSSRGTAFPSSHAAVAVAQAVVSITHDRRLGAVVAVTSLLLMIGAVYGGFHYAVDVLAGGALGAGIAVGVAVGLRRSGRQGRFTTCAR